MCKKMIKCSKCGKYHSLMHECNQMNLKGVIFADDRKCYDWNCNCPSNSALYEIEERILSSFINSKANSMLIYE